MSIYGNILLNFAEQFIDIECYSVKAKIDSGFIPTGEKRIIRAIFQTGTGTELAGPGKKLNKYTNWGGVSDVSHNELWALEKLVNGTLIRRPGDDWVYRIVSTKDWFREAGYYAYLLERVTGDTGEQTEEIPLYGGKY